MSLPNSSEACVFSHYIILHANYTTPSTVRRDLVDPIAYCLSPAEVRHKGRPLSGHTFFHPLPWCSRAESSAGTRRPVRATEPHQLALRWSRRAPAHRRDGIGLRHCHRANRRGRSRWSKSLRTSGGMKNARRHTDCRGEARRSPRSRTEEFSAAPRCPRQRQSVTSRSSPSRAAIGAAFDGFVQRARPKAHRR